MSDSRRLLATFAGLAANITTHEEVIATAIALASMLWILAAVNFDVPALVSAL